MAAAYGGTLPSHHLRLRPGRSVWRVRLGLPIEAAYHRARKRAALLRCQPVNYIDQNGADEVSGLQGGHDSQADQNGIEGILAACGPRGQRTGKRRAPSSEKGPRP